MNIAIDMNILIDNTNCRVGSACNACPEGQYWTVKVNDALGRPRDLKVCSPTCSKYCRAGNRASDGRPWCQCYDPAVNEIVKGVKIPDPT
ncbi:hypothetical protein MAR_035927 [Mya arenaria]|uniref:Uncharacterized protein n=1 Tax=Mya arenaria TaxID=6604 RepID=A0ABY7EQ50_MYAAR|nr:hypothetical protein MAR_035927 [Mya arenaria]